MSRIRESIETEDRLVFSRGWEWRELGLNANRYRASYGDVRNVLEFNSDDGCTTYE